MMTMSMDVCHCKKCMDLCFSIFLLNWICWSKFQVEKQKIVRDSMSRHTCLLNGDRGQLGSQFAGGAVQSFSSEALVNRQKLNDLEKSKTMPTSTLGAKSNISVTGLKTKAPTSIKKQSGSSNFFDR